MKRLLVFIAALLGLASAYLRSYEVTPTSPAWSGTVWGGEDYGIGQTITANFDSVCYCELFAGKAA
jgi:hypothetical protein